MPSQDVVWSIRAVFGRGVSPFSGAEGESNRGRAYDARSRAHDDLDPTEVRSVAGGSVHQGQEHDTSCAGVRREEAELRRIALLGTWVLRFHGGSG